MTPPHTHTPFIYGRKTTSNSLKMFAMKFDHRKTYYERLGLRARLKIHMNETYKKLTGHTPSGSKIA